MKCVFLLEHSYERTPHSEPEVKIIGIYETRKDAEAAIERISKKPGFSIFPNHFNIDAYDLGEDCWPEGFFTEHYTPQWEVWEKESSGSLSRVRSGLTENEALRLVRDHQRNKSATIYLAKEVR